MKIKRGYARTVIIFRKTVIKFPRFYFRKALKIISYELRRGNLLRHLSKYTTEHFGTIQITLFKGLAENWREFTFYQKHKSPILMPTFFSLFGLFNIQKAGSPLTMNSVDLWCQLYEMTNKDVFDHSHLFSNPKNFCIVDGHLKIIDYGSWRSHRVIKKWGEKIYKNFDFSYKWEEWKELLKK